MWPFGRFSAAECKADAARAAGVLFPLTPALSPRRGGALGHRWKIRTLRLQSPLLCPSFRSHTTTKAGRIIKALVNVSPSPQGRGRGEGERSKLQPKAHDGSRSCQTGRVTRQSRGFPNLIMNRFEELAEKYLDEVLLPAEGRELAKRSVTRPSAATASPLLRS